MCWKTVINKFIVKNITSTGSQTRILLHSSVYERSKSLNYRDLNNILRNQFAI